MKYWAFISYSSRDESFARGLHRFIESYGLPAELVGRVTPAGEPAPKRLRPVFRDRTELSASSDLDASIVEALRVSRFLIVVCSRQAARSNWVQKEIETFCSLHGAGKVLAILCPGKRATGNVEDYLPQSLSGINPLVADARPGRDGIRNARLKLLAGMLGVGFDALKKRDLKRRRQQIGLRIVAATLIAAVVAVSMWRVDVAARREREAKRQQDLVQYRADMLNLYSAWTQGDESTIRATLSRYAQNDRPANDRTRGLEWSLWNSLPQALNPVVLRGDAECWTGVSFDFSGKRLAAVDRQGHGKVWDLVSGTTLYDLPDEARGFALASDGAKWLTLLTSVSGSRLRIRSTEDGSLIRDVQLSPFTTSFAAAPDGSWLLCGDMAGDLWACDFPSGDNARKLTRKLSNPVQGRSIDISHGAVSEVAFSPDGEFYASGCEDGVILVWGRDGMIKTRYRGHTGGVLGICFSRDGKLFASQSIGERGLDGEEHPGELKVWVAATGETLSSMIPIPGSLLRDSGLLGGGEWTVGALRPVLSDDSARVHSCGAGRSRVWDARSGRPLRESRAPHTQVGMFASSRDLARIASASGNAITVSDGDPRPYETLCSTRGYVYGISVDPVGRFVAAVVERRTSLTVGQSGVRHPHSGERALQVFSSTTGHEAFDEIPVLSTVQRPWTTGRGEVVGAGAVVVRFPSGERVEELGGSVRIACSSDGVTCVRLTNDGAFLESSSAGSINLSDSPMGAICVRVSDDDRWVALGGSDGRISVFSTSDGSRRECEFRQGTAVTALAWSPDGVLLASGGHDGHVQLWDSSAATRRFTLAGHGREVSDILFASGGSRLVSSSGSPGDGDPTPGEVWIWDVESGTQLAKVPTRSNEIYSGLAMAPDGSRLYAAANDVRAEVPDALTLALGGAHTPPTIYAPPPAGHIVYWPLMPLEMTETARGPR